MGCRPGDHKESDMTGHDLETERARSRGREGERKTGFCIVLTWYK